jgi:hypothetical protein
MAADDQEDRVTTQPAPSSAVASSTASPAARRPAPLLAPLLTLLGLTGFAVSQPLLSVAGENPPLFTSHHVDGWGLVLVALAVALVPPLLLWFVVVAVGAVHRTAGRVVHVGLLAVLAGLTVIQVLKGADVEHEIGLVVLSLGAAAAFACAFLRWRAVEDWARYTAVLPALAVVVFLAASPSADLLSAPEQGAAAGGGDLPPVVMILLDELPTMSILDADGGIDKVRFPNLARFSDDATWFRNYSVLAPATLQSVPSILSGQEPKLGPALWTNHPDNLFSLFAPTHELTAFETATRLCGFSNCGVEGASDTTTDDPRVGDVLGELSSVWGDRVSPEPLPPLDFGEFEEEVTELEAPTGAEALQLEEIGTETEVAARPTRVTEFLDSLGSSEGPTFSYLHLMLPHQPWNFGPTGVEYRQPKIDIDPEDLDDVSVFTADEWSAATTEQRHLLQAEYADRLVGQVLDRLEETGVYDEALVVITADHGIHFEQGRLPRSVAPETVDGVAYSPLLIKEPGQDEDRIDDSNLTAVDLLPTIAARAGVDVPFEVDGLAAGSPGIEERGEEKYIYAINDPTHPDLDEIIEFDDSSFPSADDRWIGPRPEGSSALYGLVARLGLEDLLGTPVDDLDPQPGPATVLFGLADLQEPPEGQPVIGQVFGSILVDAPDEAEVVVAIDGEIVSAAPVREGGFSALLPSELIDRAGNDVRVVLLDGDQALELELAPG